MGGELGGGGGNQSLKRGQREETVCAHRKKDIKVRVFAL